MPYLQFHKITSLIEKMNVMFLANAIYLFLKFSFEKRPSISFGKKVLWVIYSELRAEPTSWLHLQTHFRSSRLVVFLGKGILKTCSKFTGEHPRQSVISIKLLCNFIEIALQHGWSPANLLHIFRTPFLRTPLDGCFCHFYQDYMVPRIYQLESEKLGKNRLSLF